MVAVALWSGMFRFQIRVNFPAQLLLAQRNQLIQIRLKFHFDGEAT